MTIMTSLVSDTQWYTQRKKKYIYIYIYICIHISKCVERKNKSEQQIPILYQFFLGPWLTLIDIERNFDSINNPSFTV